MQKVRFPIASAALILALTASGAPAQDANSLVATLPSITVDGDATQEAVPDLAVVTVGVVTERPSAVDAAAENARAAAAVVKQIESEGITETDIQTSQLTLSSVTDPRNGSKTKGYQARNRVTFRVRAIDKLGEVVGHLIDKGANEVEGIDFSVEDERPILDRLRVEATKDALRKARLYAEAAGVKLGRVLQIAPDGASTMPVYRVMKMQAGIADAPSPPVRPGTQTLDARVKLTLELLP